MKWSLEPELSEPQRTVAVRRRRIALAAVLACSALFGVLDPLLGHVENWELISLVLDSVFTACAFLAWVHHDAALRETTVRFGLRLLIFLVVPAGLAVYFVKSRGWRGAAKAGFGLPMVLAALAVYFAVFSLVEWGFVPA